jgi:alanyl-tRNA synthetase
MTAAEIRQRFLDYFARHGHRPVPSSGLVPRNDPTLLFTNAGMVQFKRVFLGEEAPEFKRAVTSQKCLRVSGKHNDLEEVGVTRRHHTFFEMLGNFSFGDYFKRDAIRFAWELMTEEYGLPRERLWATVHHSDDEAAGLWREIAGLPAERIFRLGDKDNFWQMGETGPCGPCSEIHFDLRPSPAGGTDVSLEDFVEYGDRGLFLELWNLVFMQFDRSADGSMTPLPAPSIDTGAGLERLASVLQGVDSNYKTDLFVPLLETAADAVGVAYDAASPRSVSHRVLADHARAVAFLLADGVVPTNDGQGYVLRRVLRRAVRHAWLLGRREPTLVRVVDRVIDLMGGAYPELPGQRASILRATTEEEERFLATIDAGMARIDELAPVLPAPVREAVGAGEREAPVIEGEDAFRLHDTFGFPLDLTELIARERGYRTDVEAFEKALEEQRERSRAARADVTVTDSLVFSDVVEAGVIRADQFVGYEELDVTTEVTAVARRNGSVAVVLRRNPFYLEAGGQLDDTGIVEGAGWRIKVEKVTPTVNGVAVIGPLEGELPKDVPFPARAVVDRRIRRDTQRNHTATHLLHAALREVLGTHVQQKGSLVAPDRLRFDFVHSRPLTPAEVRDVETRVNEAVLEDHEVRTDPMAYADAVGLGAMALFGEKYGDVVRVVTVPGVSRELCGGTHVRHTGDIGLFRIVSETGVAAGVRRIEALTGTEAWRRATERELLVESAAAALRGTPDTLLRKIEQVQEENRELRRQLERARRGGGGDRITELLGSAVSVNGLRLVAAEVEADGADELRALGDGLRERLGSGAAVLAGRSGDRVALLAVVTDDLPGRGIRADRLIRAIAALTGGTGGGRAHMAQGGAGDPAKVGAALSQAADILRGMAEAG